MDLESNFLIFQRLQILCLTEGDHFKECWEWPKKQEGVLARGGRDTARQNQMVLSRCPADGSSMYTWVE